jgi:ribosomal protein S18 acetylase RimI-like enzyme
MKPTIRPATIEDHAAIAHIAGEVDALHARALPDRFREGDEVFPVDHLRGPLDSDRHGVIVAECDGEIVGYAWLQLMETHPHPMVMPRKYARIDQIGVLAAEQGTGIGRLLVDAAVRWARERHATEVQLNVYELNDAAIGFYEHLGFATLRRTMTLPLDERPPCDDG